MPEKSESTVDETIAELLHSPNSSPWLKGVLQVALADDRDPGDIARDATRLAAVLVARARVMCSPGMSSPVRYAGVDLWLPDLVVEPLEPITRPLSLAQSVAQRAGSAR